MGLWHVASGLWCFHFVAIKSLRLSCGIVNLPPPRGGPGWGLLVTQGLSVRRWARNLHWASLFQPNLGCLYSMGPTSKAPRHELQPIRWGQISHGLYSKRQLSVNHRPPHRPLFQHVFTSQYSSGPLHLGQHPKVFVWTYHYLSIRRSCNFQLVEPICYNWSRGEHGHLSAFG